jgi:hypothetical protein
LGAVAIRDARGNGVIDRGPDAVDQADRDVGAPRERIQWLAVWIALAVVTMLAIHRLRDFPARLDPIAAIGGIATVISATGWAAVKVWSFWSLGAAVLAGLALRADPEIEPSDALLLGAGGLWVIAYLLGNLLGPVGLFDSVTIWGLLALAAAYLWRSRPRVARMRATSGQRLAVLALALLAVSYLPLELASPVVPFMDVLSYPSSVQRILTFHVYLPFNNDAYGCWGPYAQTPALELFYAMLALGSHTSMAVLAESGAMLPMAALIIFATYRLGRMLFGDTAGGMAALLLFLTDLFRRAQGMRGTAVDFALVALGLAFFMDRSRRRIFLAAGAAMLGTAIASHAIDGGFAMIVAAAGALMWLGEGDRARFAAGAAALGGALLLAAPEFFVAFAHPVPYPALPVLMLAGVASIAAGAWMLAPAKRAPHDSRARIFNVALIGLFILAALYRHATIHGSILERVSDDLPLLFVFAFAGLIAAIEVVWSERPLVARYGGLAAAALLLGVIGDYGYINLLAVSRTQSGDMMAWDLWFKLWDYWCPYFLVFPAGLLFALAYRRWSRPLIFFALLTILIYPWYRAKVVADHDSLEHSITELWAFNLSTAATGYWADHDDRRWTFGPPEMALLGVLEREIAAGRITTATHVLHICKSISPWKLVQFSIFTGIDDDPIEIKHDSHNLYEAGGRVRAITDLGVALAARPPYIFTQVGWQPSFGKPPAGYDLIFTRGPLELYRRRDLAVVDSPPPRELLWRWLPGSMLLALALAIALRRERSGTSAQPSTNEGAIERGA